MKRVKKGMTREQRIDTADKLAKDFLKRCDGMYCDEVIDVLHWHFLFCMSSFCDYMGMDLKESLSLSKQFIQESIDNINHQDKRLN